FPASTCCFSAMGSPLRCRSHVISRQAPQVSGVSEIAKPVDFAVSSALQRMTWDEMTMNEDHAEIREAVRKLCARFPGEYWRALDRQGAYPTEFVAALTEAGYL